MNKLKRFKIKDYGFKIAEARIARKIKHSRFVRKIKHLKIAKKVREHKRLSVGIAVLLVVLPVLVGTLAYIQHKNNQEFLTTLPYNEKIAEGAWILHNQEPVRQIVNDSSGKIDLNLKEVMNIDEAFAEESTVSGDIAKPFDTLAFKWVVALPDKTYFEFGGVDASTPNGKVLPVVRVRNSAGAYVAFAPKSMKQESGITNNDDKTSNSEFIIHDSVTPKVDKNVISWEIFPGITARYTLMADRVKADYIINQKSDISNQSLDFDLEYGGGELLLDPAGNLSLNKQNYTEGSGEMREIFTIPIPVVQESPPYQGSKGQTWEGIYDLNVKNENTADLAIVLPIDKLSNAQFPVTVDPTIIDNSTGGDSLRYSNGRNLFRDSYGNLIAVFNGWTMGRDHVYYKNYDSSGWIDAEISLDNSGNNYCRHDNFAGDIDSTGDVHVVAHLNINTLYCGVASDESLNYARLNVRRDGSNRITDIIVSDFEVLDHTDDSSNAGSKPSLIVANKGGGPGVEKVVITWGEQISGTLRSEMRVIQKDIWNVGYEDMILDDSSLVGYWRLNERSYGENVAYDISPTNNDGTFGGTPTMNASPAAILGDSENTAVNFVADSYVQLTNQEALNPGSAKTWEFWVKRNTIQDDTNFYSKASAGNFYGMADGTFRLGNDNGTVSTSTSTALSDNGWHHIVVTYAGPGAGNTLIYIDGVEGHTDGSQISIGLKPNAIAPRIGAYASGLGEDSLAVIDEVAIYGDILTASEITQHFNKAKETFYSNTILNTPGLSGYFRLGTPSGTLALDESTTGNHGTFANVSAYGVKGATGSDFDTAVTFSGAADSHVIAPDNDAYDFGTGDFTVEAWIKRTANPATSEYIVGHDGNGAAGDWGFWQDATSGQCLIFRLVGGSGISHNGGCSAGFNDNRWHHVVFSADRDGSGTFYVDGKASGEVNLSADTGNISSTSNLYIGDRTAPNTEWTGSIDEVAIYKGVALTADQVMEHYQAANDWKNASEEINSNGSFGVCNDTVTRGEAGFAVSNYCKGTTDKVFGVAAANIMHGVINQIPGTPARTPDSVKWDDNGSFSNLTSAFDGNRNTTSSINGFTTADYLYIGDDKPFSKVSVNMFATNSATADFAITDVEYCSLSYDGTTCTTWTDLANFYDYTDNGVAAFSEDGGLYFDEPDNWATVTVNSTAGKYWIRIRPDAAMDSDVKIAEITINDRNSNALILMGGSENTNGLQPAIVPWDDITNESWENRADSAGAPWWEHSISSGFWGFANANWSARWTYQSGFSLTSTIDYINDRFFVNVFYDQYVAPSPPDPYFFYIYSVGNNKDPLVLTSWTNTDFPFQGPNNEGISDNNPSLTTDGSDIYLFLNPDNASSTQSSYFMKCTPYAAKDPKICDSFSDWGEKVVYAPANPQTTSIEPIISKVTSDASAIDFLLDIDPSKTYYERIYTDSNDRKKTGASSWDDAFHRDCDSGTDDQDIGSIVVKLGREDTDGSCVGSVDSENHAGFRFQNVNVAPGAKISSAYIDFNVASRSGTTALDFTIYGEDEDDSSSFNAVLNGPDPLIGNIGERTLTTSSITQSINFEPGSSANEGISYRFDVTDIVQEIICRGVISTQPCVGDFNGTGAWVSGNDLSILLKSSEGGNTDNWINIFAFDDTRGSLEPTLQINCEDSCDEPKPQETTWCNLGTANANASNDCNNNWGSRKKITFDNRASSENLTEFPVLVRLDSTKIDYSKVQNAGQDLRFLDATGGAVLRYDIEKWDEEGESIVWVRVPQIDATSNTDYVYMYYNNSKATTGEDPPNTWNSNYKGVWHLAEGSSTNADDETSLGNDLTLNSSSWNSNSILNTGWNGIGSNWLSRTDDPDLDFGTGSLNISFWFRSDSAANPAANEYLIDKEAGTGYAVYANTSGNIIFGIDSDGTWTPNDTAISTSDIYDGNWHYVSAVKNGTSSITLYVDGVAQGSDVSITASTISNADPITVGSQDTSDDTDDFNGDLDELEILSTNSSADWVEASYLNTKSNSTFLSIAEEEIDPTISDYEALISAESNLTGYFRLGELTGTNANDSSSTNNDGTYTGSPTLGVTGSILGDKDTAATFNGSTQYVLASDNNAYDFGTGDYSLEAWVKRTSQPAQQEFILGHSGNGASTDWEMFWGCCGYDQLGSRVGGGPGIQILSGNEDISDDSWHHVVFTADRDGNGTWYKDGVVSGTPVDISSQSSTDITSTSTLYIGRRNDTSCSGDDCYFQGGIDEVAIYKGRVLSASDVLAHYNTGRESIYKKTITGTNGLVGYWRLGEGGGTVAEDLSSTGNDGTYTNTPTLGATGSIKGDNDTSVTFTAASQEYVTISDNSAYSPATTGDLSVEAWIKGGATAGHIVTKGNWDDSGSFEWQLNWNSSQGFSAWAWAPDGTQIGRVDSPTGLAQNVWHHLVVIFRQSGNMEMYVDGALTEIDTMGATTDKTSPVEIAARADHFDSWLNGSIDDVAIYNVALTGDQVKEHYLAGGGTNKYNLRQFSKGVSTATGSASFSDLDARFSSADYVAVQGDDETYVDLSSDVNVSRDPDANPAFMLKINNAKNSNLDRINASAVVRSNAPTTDYPIYLQVYRGGETDNWETIAYNNTSKADTDITLTGVTVASNTSEYYINETSGVGTVGAECTNDTSNCWTYFRIYQDTVDDSVNTILSLDAFDENFDSIPSNLVFTNAWNYIPTNTCSGSTGSFTLQMQDENGDAASPTQLTTVRITSNTTGALTLYSDSACIFPVTNGDLIFTTLDTSKTFYLRDNGISNDYTLTATTQSGDTMSADTTNYTIEGGLRLESRTRIKGGGDTRIRGGTRFR